MSDVISHRLRGSAVVDHFLSALEIGGDGAREQFIKVKDRGDFFALAPEGQTDERLNHFRTGGVFPLGTAYQQGKYRIREVPNHAAALASVIKLHAEKLRRPLLLLHEPYLTENDKTPIVRELTEIDSARYKVLPPAELHRLDVATQIGRFTVSWHALVILVEQPPRLQVRRVIESAKLVAVGAYKGESYVYWLRRPARSSSRSCG